MPEILMTPEDAARRLAVSPKTLRQWLRTGRLGGVKAGRLWRLREEDLAAFLVMPRPTDSATRAEKIRAVKGMFAGSKRSVDDFLREKHEETESEERRKA